MSGLDELRAAAAAANARPVRLRAARQFAAGLEERAVKEVLRLTGGDLGEGNLRARMLARSRERTGRPSLSFAMFHDLVPDFPATLRTGRLRFDYTGIMMELMNGFDRTPMAMAWEEASASAPAGRPLGLVFSWPKVRGCRNLCVFHDAEVLGRPPAAGTRLTRLVGGTAFSVETLPSFLDAMGVLAAGPDAGDDDNEDEGEDDG